MSVSMYSHASFGVSIGNQTGTQRNSYLLIFCILISFETTNPDQVITSAFCLMKLNKTKPNRCNESKTNMSGGSQEHFPVSNIHTETCKEEGKPYFCPRLNQRLQASRRLCFRAQDSLKYRWPNISWFTVVGSPWPRLTRSAKVQSSWTTTEAEFTSGQNLVRPLIAFKQIKTHRAPSQLQPLMRISI